MRQVVFVILHFRMQVFLGKHHFSIVVLPVKLPFVEACCNRNKSLESIFVKPAVQSVYMYQRQGLSGHFADKGYG